ncbi:MAG: hypothetical protein U0R65_08050 [Candidatus Nanopelagicales bacterium]|mgnify:CR=1 FL=1|jgi:2-keto-4-pentenoate hydratase
MPVDEHELAARIVIAHERGELLPAPVDHGLDGPAAYRVQSAVVGARRSARRVGWKLGYTSEAMRRQMGVDQPNFGPLHDGMVLSDGAQLAGGVVQPRVEPELAAVMAQTADDPDDLIGAVAGWYASIEVVDSVWHDYRFDWALNTADGSSAAFVVVGDQVAEGTSRELSRLPVALAIDGGEVATGTADAAMGDPWAALRWLAGQLAAQGERLQHGDIVITGGLTRAFALEPGTSVVAQVGSGAARLSRA